MMDDKGLAAFPRRDPPARGAVLTEVPVPGGLLVCLQVDLDVATVGRVGSALADATRRCRGQLVVDVAGRFVGMTGITALAALTESAAATGVTVTVAGLNRVWERLLPLLGVGPLNRRPDVATALEDFHP